MLSGISPFYYGGKMHWGNRFIVITGGPGSGKSTLLRALAKEGFAVMPEAGRAIIQSQLKIGGKALPWSDRMLYAELMLMWEMRSYADADRLVEDTVFFDRGIPDVAGYLQLCNLKVPEYAWQAAKQLRYYSTVFIAPPWREIYVNDIERKQSWEEAVATHDMMRKVYENLGYNVVSLPLTSVNERVRFIKERLGQK